MTTLVAVLSLSFLCLCVAEVQQLDRRGGEVNNPVIDSSESACHGDCDLTRSQKKSLQPTVNPQDLEARLENAEKQLDNLRKSIQDRNVAFGASLGIIGTTGPIPSEITLIYKNVYTNTGAYNSATGIFTAPVKGAYYFSFSGHNVSSKAMSLRLMKNGVQMVTVFNHIAGNRYETATNGMILQLQVGDKVYMRLRENTWIFDNVNNHSTFIGYLLFPL